MARLTVCWKEEAEKNKLETSITNRQFLHLLRSGLFTILLVALNGYLCLPPGKGHSTHSPCKPCWLLFSLQ